MPEVTSAAAKPSNGVAKIVWWVMGIFATVAAAVMVGAWTQSGRDHDKLNILAADFENHEDWGKEKYAEILGRFTQLEARLAEIENATRAGNALTAENGEILKRIERKLR